MEFRREDYLSYFHRDLDIVRKLSDCVISVKPETVIMEAMDISGFIREKLTQWQPELSTFLNQMYDTIDYRLKNGSRKFRYGELLKIVYLAKARTNLKLRRYLCAYKMLLTTTYAERHFVDGILIFFSATIEQKVKDNLYPEKDPKIMESLNTTINGVIRNLTRRNAEYTIHPITLPDFVYSELREREEDYVKKLYSRLKEVLEVRSKPIRKKILMDVAWQGEYFIPPHEAPITYGYKFRRSLYSNHTMVLKDMNRSIRNMPKLTQDGYALYISYSIMDAFRKERTLYEMMYNSMKLLRKHLDHNGSKSDVSKSLVRLINTASQDYADSTCYQIETFVNAMESILGSQVYSRAIRSDLSASLEANYHIQSPRKTSEILSYHRNTIEYMDDVMKGYDNLLPAMDDMMSGKLLVAEEEAPYRPDMDEKDMDHLMSGAENVQNAYEKYLKNTRTPRPLDEKLRKDSIDEDLSRTDDIRYEIFSIVPASADLEFFRNMNFNIRDIF